MLTHEPDISDEIVSKDNTINLILAGHSHGGQWRIPFYGAVFISNVYGSRWFPSQESVSGLTIWSGYQQYVSRGLGASGRSGWIKQRWFNPPEVNVLTQRNLQNRNLKVENSYILKSTGQIHHQR